MGIQKMRGWRARCGWVTFTLSVMAVLPTHSLSLFRVHNLERKNIPYTIVATVGMIGDITAQIVGSRAQVITLMQSGVDPHLYTPTRSDVQRLLQADVVLYVGLLLEGRMSTVLKRLEEQRAPQTTSAIYGIGDRLAAQGLLPLFETNGHTDPHIWMDVSLWQLAVTEIAEALSAFDPEWQENYRTRAARYTDKLQELHRYIQEVIASIPAEQRVLVTAHDAFSYFGSAYGIRVEGIQGLSTESEAGVKRINALVSFLLENRVPAIFVESSVHDKNVRALVEGVTSRGGQVYIGGTLFSDAMGESGSYRGSYIGMLDHNATTISRALGGTAPKRGVHQRLDE